MRIHRITAALGAAALAVTLLPPALSSAAANEAGVSVLADSSWAVSDATEDVWSFNYVDGYEFFGAAPRADVLSATAQHTKRKISWTMTFDDIVLGDQQEFAFQIKTPKMTRYGALYFLFDDTTGAFILEKPDRTSVSVKGVTWAVDDVEDTVRVTMPRRRFKDPAWVKIAMFNLFWSDDGVTLLEDNPHNESFLDEAAWLETPPLSPKLYPR